MSNDREHQQRLSLGGQAGKGGASCPKCREQGLTKCVCGPGQGGKSGGSGGSGSGGKEGPKESAPTTVDRTTTSNMSSTTTAINDLGDIPQRQSTDVSFNPAVISQLLSDDKFNKLFSIEKTELGIKVECKPELFKFLSAEQNNELKKFFDHILKEFNALKEKNENISDRCCNVFKDKQGHYLSLKIDIPNIELCNKFMKKVERLLTIEGLVSFLKSDQKMQTAPDQSQETSKKRSPWDVPTPKDGLKPKGFE